MTLEIVSKTKKKQKKCMRAPSQVTSFPFNYVPLQCRVTSLSETVIEMKIGDSHGTKGI